ncbi:MAG: hypothetical protein QF570_14025 [Myxococcota bacterium]|nr:hypothetical protein [Myxococcota bacterium]
MKKPWLGAFAVFAGVLGVAFFEILIGAKTVVHGDALSVALPFQKLFVDHVSTGHLPLWSSLVYGGHPVFAEGQGAFAHPLTWLVFGPVALFAPGDTQSVSPALLYAHGFFHFACALIAAMGMYAFARTFELRPVSAVFAGLALAGSQGWFYLTLNATIAGATAWVPWFFASFERWRRTPDRAHTLELGLAAALIALAGYPQTVHAVALFAAAYFALRSDGALWRSPARHLLTGVVALSIALALSAVQWLPTLELAGESIRAEGTSLAYSHTFAEQWRGNLFSVGDRNPLWPGLGSLLAFSLVLVGLTKDRRVLAIGGAVALLYMLGMGEHAWLYRVAHDWLPGLDRFRIVWMYSTVGLVGLSLLAGFGVDALCDRTQLDQATKLRLGVVALVATTCAYVLHIEPVSAINLWVALAASIAIVALLQFDRSSWVGPLLVGLLALEIVMLRVSLQTYGDARAVREPPSTVRFLLDRKADELRHKTINLPHTHTAIAFAPADRENIPDLASQFVHSFGDGSGVLWSLASVRSNLALPSARQGRVERVIDREARGEGAAPAGRRVIDALGLRYFVFNWADKDEPYPRDFERVFDEAKYGFWIRENPHARSGVQLIGAEQVRVARDADEVEALFSSGSGGRLVIEDPSGERSGGDTGVTAPEAATPAGRLGTIRSTGSSLHVEVRADRPAYLFVADTPYPGWTARIDGEPAPLLAANLLGKAVAVEPGLHTVELEFESASFRFGAVISALAAVALFAEYLRQNRFWIS